MRRFVLELAVLIAAALLVWIALVMLTPLPAPTP